MAVDVSVVIAARNEELFVEEAVRSILEQEGLSLELIFVDDASSDRTFEIVDRLAGEYPTLRPVRNPEPGKVRAFNLGIAQAQADWVCIFSGDDIMPQGSLAERWRAVKDVVSDKPVIGVCRLVTMSEDKSKDGQVIPRDPTKGTFSGSCYMMSRAALAKMWPVPTRFPNEDTWLELCAHHFDMEVVHSGVIGCVWRIHANNSINLEVPFSEFNPKITVRMAAAGVFLDRYRDELSHQAVRALEARVRCEEARKAGSLIGILRSGATPIAKLRAISLSNPFFYWVRQRAYALLSGW